MAVSQAQVPTFSPSQAEALAQQHYGLTVIAKPLPSYRDQNFQLKTDLGAEYVLKVANADQSTERLAFENEVMTHLSQHFDPTRTPQLCPTLNGEAMIAVDAPDDVSHLMRLVTFLPGTRLSAVKPHSPELLHSLGRFLAQFDKALLNFQHPAMRRQFKWDLQQATLVSADISHIKNPQRRTLIKNVFSLYKTQALPVLPSLRHSVIHNDANDNNLLVNPPAQLPRQISGIFDFGDLIYTATVCELAIACAYAMLNKANPLSTAEQVISGYHQLNPLTEAELAALFPLICTRLAVSVVMSAVQQAKQPDNDYIAISEKPAWDMLEYLADISPNLAHYRFRSACNLPPVPQTERITGWLAENGSSAASIVPLNLKTAPITTFDLSVASPMLAQLDNLDDTAQFTRHLFAKMMTDEAEVGLGRYNEARRIYTSHIFITEGEWRTIHLGIDLFMPAGTPVYAPFSGTIHSFQNNDNPLDYGPTIILRHTPAEGIEFFTLYGHLSLNSLNALKVGQTIAPGQQIGEIGDFPVNGNWPPHLHFQIITDMLGREGEFPGVALPSQREVWLSLSPNPNLVLAIPQPVTPTEMPAGDILNARSERLGPSLSISYQKPLKIGRGSGQYLYDEGGQAYLDCVNNVCHVGHSHPKVVRAGASQMAVLNTNTRYLHPNLVEYAERLCATLPEPLRVCFFVCTGSEANELALRLAQTHTAQKDTLVIDGAYHGNTNALIALSPYKFEGPGGPGISNWVHKVTMPDPYRGPYKADDPQAGQKYADDVQRGIEGVQASGKGIAAFFAESLLGCGGQIVLPEGYLRRAFAYVRGAGGVCVADEVQVGFGRVGTHFWGFETQGVVPDIVTMGKPIGNGHPLAAVVTTPEIAASFHNGMEYFNTFGGNPVSCAIGLAVLDVIAEEKLQENAHQTGQYLLARLKALQTKHPIIGQARGLGLFIGLELVINRRTLAPAAEQASYIVERMKERGILLSTDGPLHNVIKIKPPLVFNRQNADFLVDTLDEILGEDFVTASVKI